MPSIFIQYIFFVVWFVQLDCEVYEDRPKIKTADGDLILQPALDRSIYLLPNGPKSNIYVGNINLLSINSSATAGNQPVNDIEQHFNILILQRLERLENSTLMLRRELLNFTTLSRRFNVINRRLSILQTFVHNLGKDECDTQCQNGGTCLNLMNGYYCLCPSNWEGRNCEIDVNECRNFMGTDLGCQNGATCINRLGSYECLCRPGWFGLHCTRKAKNCQGGDYEMCGHGTCITTETGEGIKCICDQGWTTNGTGITCLSDVNECDSSQGARCSMNPKVDCINLPGSFRCGRCPSGYDGDGFACYDIDECVTIPNGGCSTSPMVACHNVIGSRVCGSCPPGYQGDGVTCSWKGSCLINRGGCHPSAQCIESPSLGRELSQCICPDGTVGDGIGIYGCYIPTGVNVTDLCEGNPCGPNGRCHPVRNGYTCICHRGYGGAHCDNPNTICATNPCHNGGTCRFDEKSETGFRCECTALYSGVLCQVHSKPCGGVLDAEEGSIVYPLSSNSTYKHNSRCAWVIHTIPDKVINVTFSKFNIEEDEDCHYDFLQIHDGRSSASQLIGRFCGNVYPKGGNIISSHNNLYFWFRSDSTVAKEGFALHWSSIKPICGGEIDASRHGHISSPGSPGQYPPNRDCYWHLTTVLGRRIQLHFFALDIETHPNCSYDYLAIYDGEHTTDPLLDKFCNSTQPAPVQSAGSEILIHFHSDAYASGSGFQIAYATLDGIPGCGGYFTTDKGEIISPSYDGKYLNNLLCDYKIKSGPGTNIRINFKSFQLENSVGCKYDYVKIYDGPSTDSPLVGKFCGNVYPKSYTSSSNTVFIQFKTDHSMASDGFKISYETICHTTVLGDSGIIKSPGYPISYPYNKKCEYIIGTSPGRSIILSFQDFDLEDNRYYNCQYDNVEIRDGIDDNATLLGRFCGGSEHTPPDQTSTFNYMYIRFTSDMSISGTGFYANFTTIDTHCGGIFRSIRGTINHPAEGTTTYEVNESCTWLLIAPEGMHIVLSWNRFALEYMESCTGDYVQLIEIDNDNNNITLGTYCGSKMPPALTVSSNRLLIKFESDGSFQRPGFSLSYNFMNENSHCGGIFVKTHGFIYSPGWPNSYEHNRDCVWVITVPAGQQILLNITNFDLERPLRGSCNFGDYLEIRNGAAQNSPFIGVYCGKFDYKRILSTANSVYIRFHSDFYISGKGFKIEWDGSISGCGGTLTSVSGMISSPNYPEPYNENAECFYRIVTNSGSRIRISFVELELEPVEYCEDDYVEIYDGRDSYAPSYGKQCFMTSKLSNIETSSNYAFIKFRSDFFIAAKGFLLNYETICNNNISGAYGVIESPGFPNLYPTNANCSWNITVPKGNKINITFTHFDISSNRPHYIRHHYFNSLFVRRFTWDRCETDYLEIKERSDTNSSYKLCGSSLPQQINVKSNSVYIHFVSGNYPRTGFRLEWVKYGCGGHIQKPFGHLNIEPALFAIEGELECDWIIESPEGTNLKLTVADLSMPTSPNCSTGAIEIYNGPNIKSPLITNICHNGPTVATASGNLMLVRFVKRSKSREIYFTSRFDSNKAVCGGTINSRSGLIHSKNYPKNYDNNINCLWFISVPKNHRIELNILDLDLYIDDDDDSSKCDDAINIYDGGQVLNTNYTYHICPDTNVTRIVTKKSSIAIQFVTDSFGSAKGFKANFTMTCGATIEATDDGIIENDKYISYSTKNCTWTIFASKLEQKIKLTITHISIPKNTDIITNRHCPSSFLKVFDGSDDSAPLIDEYCGRKIPPLIVSHGNAITIQLGTHSNIIDGLFTAHYSSLTSACGGSLTSEEGSIASPNYPQSYPVDTDCVWILSTSPGNRVYVTFEQFDLAYSENCNEDYLEIRENNGGGQLLGVYCGSNIPANTTTGTKLYIKFHSDSRNAGQGFILHYGFLHGNEITGLESGEIASPLYPFPYDASGEYTWRIIISGTDTISINIDHLEIYRREELCNSYLAVYDGYNDESPLIYQECGILKLMGKELQTTSSVAYIKLVLDVTNKGSLFHLRWNKSNKNIEMIEVEDKINCGFNHTELVLPGRKISFSSPNYPQDYGLNLNCDWIFKSDFGRHLMLILDDMSLEESTTCYADYISIYASSNLANWSPIKEHICLSQDVRNYAASLSYLKVKFITDSSLSLKGFRATVKSVCGGLITNLSGSIKITWSDMENIVDRIVTCEWTIKVRPERNIILTFEHFNITNDANQCTTYVLVRNGQSTDSPLIGKYCGYAHENRSEIVTSANAVFIKYVSNNNPLYTSRMFQNFWLHYEEKNIECGATSQLDSSHVWEVIMSPNYPNSPAPYTECVWIISGPPGEILRLDFIDRFDLQRGNNCPEEYMEIRDGSSELSPLKGIYCGTKPGTIKTSSNYVYIKYITQLLEPRDGFKANISVDICGGTIIGYSGELISPGYPNMINLPYGTVCEWRIISPIHRVIRLHLEDLNLPDSESPCATKLTIEEPVPANNTVTILKNICEGDENEDTDIIESFTNEVTIKLYIGKPSDWEQNSEYRGFKLTFNSSRPTCSELITTPEGFLMTPGYPRKTSLRYCQWIIKVPDMTRRVRLELIDIDTNNQIFGFYNDQSFRSLIQPISSSYIDGITQPPRFIESTGNTMVIYLWIKQQSTPHRFKARFTSDEEVLCGGQLSGVSGTLKSPGLNRSYTCEWRYENANDAFNSSLQYKSIYVNVNLNSSITRAMCRFSDSSLTFKTPSIDRGITFSRNICSNHTNVSYRVPTSSMHIIAIQNYSSFINFQLNWRLQPCGGVVHVGYDTTNILNVPIDHNDTLDCGWIVVASAGIRLQIQLEGSFTLDCENEYLKVNQGLGYFAPAIGDYCRDRMPNNPLSTSFRHTHIQYHSNAKIATNLKVMIKSRTDQCGGFLSSDEHVFASPNFPKGYPANSECTWEILADLGNRISLQFIDRFAIEDTTNCTKDVLILYDWKDDAYLETARICGRQIPQAFNSTNNKMKVVLRTDASTNLDGFRAHWNPICGGHFMATNKEQFIYSPGYPIAYSPSLNCLYVISATEGKITLKFLDFELEGTHPECQYDNVTITGQGSNFVYDTYCEKEMPVPLNNYEELRIQFQTDAFTQRKGFKLSYSIYSCGGKVNNPTMLTLGDTTYENNMNCTWIIEAPPNKIVVFKFLYIELEDTMECYNDYIAIFDGDAIDDSKRLALMCGSLNSTTVRSNSNNALLQFKSDSSLSYYGFKVQVFFSYSKSIGCGGYLNLTNPSNILKSPVIGTNVVYENYLDCNWEITAPIDHFITITFLSFHISSCENVNQTALSYNKCDCDAVELRDGINPNSLVIGRYCGHTLPPQLMSSRNLLSIRLSTDGEINSSGFEALLTVNKSICGQSTFVVSNIPQRWSSPGYESSYIPRGLHCTYELNTDFSTVQITIHYLDIQAGTENKCDIDKFVITGNSQPRNITFGQNFILREFRDGFFSNNLFHENSLRLPSRFELCGLKSSLDFYVYGSVSLNLFTAPNADIPRHRGVDIEIVTLGFCGRNYTGTQGRIQSGYDNNGIKKDCFTLITAPVNHTISIYFMSLSPQFSNLNDVYFEVFDGNSTDAKSLLKISDEYYEYPIFSTGRYLLLHNRAKEYFSVTYDLNFVTTDRGPGCGGVLNNEIGRITSPMYPDVYRQKSTCEWEINSSPGTRLFLRFSTFDLGRVCDQNYVELIDKNGNTVSKYCEENPADHISKDNFIKIVFVTTMNNGGTGWVADFIGII